MKWSLLVLLVSCKLFFQKSTKEFQKTVSFNTSYDRIMFALCSLCFLLSSLLSRPICNTNNLFLKVSAIVIYSQVKKCFLMSYCWLTNCMFLKRFFCQCYILEKALLCSCSSPAIPNFFHTRYNSMIQ